MKTLLKLSLLASVVVFASCSHCGKRSQCDMKSSCCKQCVKEGEQCPMMKKDEAAPAAAPTKK